MGQPYSRFYNDSQDRTSYAWGKLCEVIDELAESGADEFSPRESLGDELFSQIVTLPTSIAKLDKVKKIWLYGSRLQRIPPEIGAMTSLEYFDPYTSYDLKWFPYEIRRCLHLVDSRVSTRALYGNFKTRKPFPPLQGNPFRYHGDVLRCSVCDEMTTYDQVEQVWISLWIGTDVLPLLANLCSATCHDDLPPTPENDHLGAHKGGPEPAQALTEQRALSAMSTSRRTSVRVTRRRQETAEGEATERLSRLGPLKLIRKIWEK